MSLFFFFYFLCASFHDLLLLLLNIHHQWILQVVSEDGKKIKRQYSPTESDIEELQVIILLQTFD